MFISAIPLSSLISTHGPVLFIIQTITFQLHTCKVLRVDFFYCVEDNFNRQIFPLLKVSSNPYFAMIVQTHTHILTR